MNELDPARRDAAVLAVLTARRRLEHMTRILQPRTVREPVARRMMAVLEIVRPLLAAVELLTGQPVERPPSGN